MKNTEIINDYRKEVIELIQNCYLSPNAINSVYSSDAIKAMNQSFDNIRKNYCSIISILTTVYKFDIKDLVEWSLNFNNFIKVNQKSLNSISFSTFLTDSSKGFLNELVNHVHSYIDRLSSLCFQKFASSKYNPEKNTVFIVHGHNKKLKLHLKKELLKNGYKPIILSEKNETGISLFDKFEKHANKCVKAVILMTKDDFVKKENNEYFQPRPNVLVELGYFLNMLKREDIIVISEKDLEFPSDVHGVSYLEFDSNLPVLTKKVLDSLKTTI